MAKISTTFGFKDEISQNLSLLNNALTGLNQTLNAMRGQLSETNTELDKMGDTGKKSESIFERLGGKLFSFNQATLAFNTVKGAIGGVVSKMEGLNAAYQAQADAEARLGAVMTARMGATSADIEDMNRHIAEFSKNSIFGKTAVSNAAQELGTYIEKADTLKGLLPMLTNMSAQAGVTSEQGLMSMATMIGKVMAGDMGGLSKRGWTFTDAEKEAFKAMDEEQRLAFLIDAANKGIGQQDKALASMMANLAQQRELEDLQMKIGGLFGPFLDALGRVRLSLQVTFYQRLASALQFVKTHINGVALAVTTALAAIGVAVLALAGYYAYLKREAIASAVQSAAAWIAAHLPFLLIVAAILAVIAGIGVLLAYSEKTFPAIGGFLGGVGSVAKEVAANMKYYFQVAIEGIVNGFRTMKDNVSDFFISMLDAVMKGFEKIAPVMDAVFKTDMTGKISGVRDTLKAIKDNTPEKFSLGWADDRTEGGIKAAWEKGRAEGSAVGANLSDKFQTWLDNKFKSLGLKDLTSEKLAEGLGEELGLTFENGALKTKDMSSLDISDDFRELIQKRATDRYDLRMSQVTPQVTINGVEITGDMSYEEFEQRFLETVREAASSSLRDSA